MDSIDYVSSLREISQMIQPDDTMTVKLIMHYQGDEFEVALLRAIGGGPVMAVTSRAKDRAFKVFALFPRTFDIEFRVAPKTAGEKMIGFRFELGEVTAPVETSIRLPNAAR